MVVGFRISGFLGIQDFWDGVCYVIQFFHETGTLYSFQFLCNSLRLLALCDPNQVLAYSRSIRLEGAEAFFLVLNEQDEKMKSAEIPFALMSGGKAMKKEIKWEEPKYCELRLGFEVTAYVYTR